MDGHIVVERESILTKGSSLRNCIMLQGSTAKSGEHYENCILAPDFSIGLKESEVISTSTDESKMLIGTSGSDRKYFRIEKDGKTAVLMECGKDDPDFERHMEYTKTTMEGPLSRVTGLAGTGSPRCSPKASGWLLRQSS